MRRVAVLDPLTAMVVMVCARVRTLIGMCIVCRWPVTHVYRHARVDKPIATCVHWYRYLAGSTITVALASNNSPFEWPYGWPARR